MSKLGPMLALVSPPPGGATLRIIPVAAAAAGAIEAAETADSLLLDFALISINQNVHGIQASQPHLSKSKR